MTRFVLSAAVLACLAALAALFAADPQATSHALRVVRDKSGRPVAVEAIGLPAAALTKLGKQEDASETFSRLLAVFVVDSAPTADLPPMAGSYQAGESTLQFTPRFPLNAGNRYRAELRIAALARPAGEKDRAPENPEKPIILEFAIPAEPAGEPTEVVKVYPTSATLPENNLRFYIHFSDSMGRGEAYQHLSLLNARGKAIESPFLEIGEELWDPRAKRLTLLIDPGRIKQGLKPREDLGPVLEAGREYTLVISRGWRDAKGRPLKAEFRKKFHTGPPVDAAIDPARWKVSPPAPGSGDPLVVAFPAPLDRALVERTISVADLDGREVAGRVTVANEERRWEFRPLAPWKAGRYQLVVDADLEDLAGNRIDKAFEIDEFSKVDQTTQKEPTRLPFEIRDRP
ncbi:MAG: Ig-like domain-containing protein [Planctomycetia bacterium]|nr:Ig-like domain-containing protein [Planctomycetia bacterium]